MRFFKHLRRSPVFSAPLAPEVSFAAIGDIHGCDTLLADLLTRLYALPDRPQKIICAGDYVDRGEESAAVLRRLHRLSQHKGLICLMGNHEQILLDFLDHPDKTGPRWLRYGGLQTLASYGLGPIMETAPAEDWAACRDRLRVKMGPELETWLRHLPAAWRSGNVAVVHAGADPALRLSEQSRTHLLWGHPDFTRTPRQDGLWVVHGHTIIDEIRQDAGRIGIDTGAYATGRLSAAIISKEGVQILTANRVDRG